MRTETLASEDAVQAEALTRRLFNASQETLDMLTIYLGERLGLYRSLATDGPATSGELAARTRIHPRYAREWLEQQAVTGILQVDDTEADPERRCYRLPRGHAESLTDPDSPFSVAPLARGLVACARATPRLLEAFRMGTGVAWADYGPDGYEAQGDFNRPWLRAQLGSQHLPSIPDVHIRLSAGPPARVADFGCGAGWASIAIAQAYPHVIVEGFDADEASIALARKHAAAAGVADRVAFEVADVTDPAMTGAYDLVVAIEVIHDLPNPVKALANMHRVLLPGGAAIALEEKVADRFTLGHPVDRFMYAFSLVMCLPVGMSQQPSHAPGTVMRHDTLRSIARQAGFRDAEVLDIDLPLQRFYRLVP